MSRSILVKMVVVLLVASLIHSVFWFFKAGQLEKHINNFVAENNPNVAIAQVEVSGFPFSQRIKIQDLKFTLPNATINKYQTVIKNLEANAGIFSDNFTVDVLEKVSVQDSGNEVGVAEFTSQPQINFIIKDGMVANFSYQDSGYRILDADKNIVYSVGSSNITLDSTVDENEQITSRLVANIKDIENFTILDAYKNSSEKRIIDAIRTGEISIGGASVEMPADNALQVIAPAAVTPVATPVTPDAIAPTLAAAEDVSKIVEQNIPAQGEVVANNEASAKSNLMIDFEYILSPNRTEQQASVPLDPSQIQESNVQYNKVLKINNFEISNSSYKIVANGQVNSFQDDNMPSGFVTIKIENQANFVKNIVDGFNKMAEQKQSAPEIQAVDLASLPSQTSAQSDAYQSFLKKMASGLPSITTELAAKNPLSKDDVIVFDIRREKNLEFVINETPLREIMGKF